MKDLELNQLDFLSGDLTEDVFLEPPQGFEDREGRVWLLKKALYGLKQAAQAWHWKLKSSLAKVGLQASASDPCLFIAAALKRFAIVKSLNSLVLDMPEYW